MATDPKPNPNSVSAVGLYERMGFDIIDSEHLVSETDAGTCGSIL